MGNLLGNTLRINILKDIEEKELNRGRSWGIGALTAKFSVNSGWISGTWMDLQSNAELRQGG